MTAVYLPTHAGSDLKFKSLAAIYVHDITCIYLVHFPATVKSTYNVVAPRKAQW